MATGEITPEISDPVIFWDTEGDAVAAMVIGVNDFDDPHSTVSLRIHYTFAECTYLNIPYGPGGPKGWSWPEAARAIREARKVVA